MALIQFVLAGVLWIFWLGWLVHLWSVIDAARWTLPPAFAFGRRKPLEVRYHCDSIKPWLRGSAGQGHLNDEQARRMKALMTRNSVASSGTRTGKYRSTRWHWINRSAILAEIVESGTPRGAVQRPSLRRTATSARLRFHRARKRSSETA